MKLQEDDLPTRSVLCCEAVSVDMSGVRTERGMRQAVAGNDRTGCGAWRRTATLHQSLRGGEVLSLKEWPNERSARAGARDGNEERMPRVLQQERNSMGVGLRDHDDASWKRRGGVREHTGCRDEVQEGEGYGEGEGDSCSGVMSRIPASVRRQDLAGRGLAQSARVTQRCLYGEAQEIAKKSNG